jgi:hypothetical protein
MIPVCDIISEKIEEMKRKIVEGKHSLAIGDLSAIKEVR